MMNFKEWLKQITVKQVIFAAMCVLLLLVVILTCMVIGKVSDLFKGLTDDTSTTPSTSESTVPTTTAPTETTVPPTTTPTETTYPTEPGHEHEFVLQETVAATCTTYGYKIYACSCGKQDIPLDDQVEPTGHSYGAGEKINATCTEDGCTRYTCVNCGNVDDRNIVTATGHSFVFAGSTAATCMEDGYDLYKCVNCEYEEQRNVVAALEHEFELVEEHLGSCTENGYTLYQCKLCGESAIDNETVAPGHSFSQWNQIADNIWVRTCDNCSLIENSLDMHITQDQVSGDLVHDANGNPYRMYLIYVGTDSSTDLIHYTINDYLNNGSLKYWYDAAQGLIVSYTTNAGERAVVILPVFQSATYDVPADTASTTPTESTGATEATEASVPTL